MKERGEAETSLAAEHPELSRAATGLIGLLRATPDSLDSIDGASVWMHHIEIAHRSGDLADHLTTALGAAEAGHYASGFSVLRTAMEHACIDDLLLLATRYREVLPSVDDNTFVRLSEEFRTGQGDWVEYVTGFERVGKGVVIERVGHFVRDDTGRVVEQLSPYYPVIERHDALLGPPDAQANLMEPFSDPDQVREWARSNRGLHHEYLRWSAIRDNLVVNGCIDREDAPRLDVHYRFLSAFTHATGTGYKVIEQRRGHVGFGRRRNHLLGELTLLYACALAIRELRAFIAFTETRPKVFLSNAEEVVDAAESVERTIGYLWFPGVGGATEFDRFEEANRRAWAGGRTTPPIPGVLRPDQIPEQEIGYYRDPLDRLARLHQGAREFTTGFAHHAMW